MARSSAIPMLDSISQTANNFLISAISLLARGVNSASDALILWSYRKIRSDVDGVGRQRRPRVTTVQDRIAQKSNRKSEFVEGKEIGPRKISTVAKHACTAVLIRKPDRVMLPINDSKKVASAPLLLRLIFGCVVFASTARPSRGRSTRHRAPACRSWRRAPPRSRRASARPRVCRFARSARDSSARAPWDNAGTPARRK